MVLLFLSTGELFFVGLIIVLLFGSKKIPEIARGLGKGIREFKNATSDIQEEIRKTSTEITQTAKVDLDKKDSKSKDSSSEKDKKESAS
ncbi:MAG: twin-arginine translocase TatA/TatE family subunit [Flavobacteriales bacterium]|nr:twin-arginine translocase TatA/TatE family subunit [Flavobacteriales bacterium]